ncbi:MAG: hypothetical protein IJX55_04045 [Clostridia bacterium]|nr:hypothetical protein [Clostridia bacterium]
MATFYNQAILSYNGNTTTSNITTGEILEVLSASKTAVVDEYSSGDAVTYVVSIINSGASAFSGLTLTDNLGEYTSGALTLVPLTYTEGSLQYYENGVLRPAPTVTAENPLTITGISVPARGNATIIYEARTNGFAPIGVGGSITNTAVISGTNVSPVTVEETIGASEEARLTISKSLSPATVTENGVITYTFIIQNSGNTAAVATDNVTVTDTFNPILGGITVAFNGETWAETTNYTYNETTGVFATVPGQITVPAATYTQEPTSGAVIVNPGVSVLTVTGTV